MYSQIAAYYDQLFVLSQEKVHWIREKLDLSPGEKVLDLGCGTGDLVLALAELGVQGIGIDNDENMVEKAREKIQQAGASRAQVMPGDMLNFSFSGAFDHIICIGNTLPHLQSMSAVHSFLKLVYDHLVPSGKVLLQTVNFDQVNVAYKEFPLLTACEGDVEFYRWYTPASNQKDTATNKVHFHIRLEIHSKQAEFQDHMPLLVLQRQDLLDALSSTGFQKIATYCGFSHTQWKKDCGGTVYVAEK